MYYDSPDLMRQLVNERVQTHRAAADRRRSGRRRSRVRLRTLAALAART